MEGGPGGSPVGRGGQAVRQLGYRVRAVIRGELTHDARALRHVLGVQSGEHAADRVFD